jgi:hypothetical protein
MLRSLDLKDYSNSSGLFVVETQGNIIITGERELKRIKISFVYYLNL